MAIDFLQTNLGALLDYPQKGLFGKTLSIESSPMAYIYGFHTLDVFLAFLLTAADDCRSKCLHFG